MSIAELLPIIRGQFSKLKVPSPHDKVFNDECLYSFDSPFSEGGLYVNIATYMGFGQDYVQSDISKGGKLYLHMKWTQVPKAAESEDVEPVSLSLGVAGGFQAESKFDLLKKHSLVVITGDGGRAAIKLPTNEIPEFVSTVINAIIDHGGSKSRMQVDSWEADKDRKVSKYAAGLQQLDNGKRISQVPQSWKCEMSGATDNLWLNLSTGYIGGGRKNWDGSGGSGAALQHYIETGKQYPLCVKLGTITATSADVYSYADDEDDLVLDPLLPQHLSHWGIDIMKLEKTDKSMSELEVDINMKYDWSKLMDGGEAMELLSGANYVGLRNIGSSCYLNSVLQVFLHLPEVKGRYFDKHKEIVSTAPSDPSSDVATQLSKLAVGLLSDRYAPPVTAGETVASATTTAIVAVGESTADTSTLEKYVVAPRMFKQVIAKGNADYSSSQQQDASLYFQYFLDQLSRSERTSLPRFTSSTATTASIFEFYSETRYQCLESGVVKYKGGASRDSVSNSLELRIPLDLALPTGGDGLVPQSKKQKIDVEQPKPLVPFEACLETYFWEGEGEMLNPALGKNVAVSIRNRIKTFPRYLSVKLGRYYVNDKWVPVKIQARVPMPEVLDLTSYRATGLQEGEVEWPADAECDSRSSSSGAVPAAVVPNEALVAELMSMGFSENGCKRAAIATNNADVETTMNWVVSHMEDPDFNDPLLPPASSASAPAPSAAGPAPEHIEMIVSMGYGPDHAAAALKACDNNIERAMDWIFSHMDNLDEACAAVNNASVTVASAASAPASSSAPLALDDGEGKYSLIGIVSHIGRNAEHGHYVCHIKQGHGWALFNDEKVAKAKLPPLEYGFMYIYRRIDGSGSI